MKNVLTQKLKTLPVAMAEFIRQAGVLADDMGLQVYLVGGFVRDLLLGVGHFDVDLVVEGDGIHFAQECARRLSLKVVTHGRFGTAALHGPDGFKADITSARKETYEKPAALPSVSKGGIKDDLFRRDFTINAMAIGINQNSYGEVFDFYGGRRDLEKKTVRALHPLSFIDDPTRILRAMRFEKRLSFRMEPRTLAWIREALGRQMLFSVQKHRLRDELVLIFKEHRPVSVLKRLWELCGYSFISPGLVYRDGWNAAHTRIQEAARWFTAHAVHKRYLDTYVMLMCLFFEGVAMKRLKETMLAFAFHKGESRRILSYRKNAAALERRLAKRDLRPSGVYRLLEPLAYEVVVLVYALTAKKRVKERIRDYLLVYHGTRLHVRGEDLALLGSRPGPHFKKILTTLLYAKVDGKLEGKDEELALARKMMARS
jgi:tRNA nucleotidyltransferase (CCA-adding enzyme)